MKINQKVRYGMACLVELSKTPNEFRDAQDIAAKQSVPPAYAHKILQLMAHRGLVFGVKGAGYQIQKSLSDITALDVVEALSQDESEPRQHVAIGDALEAHLNKALQSFSLQALTSVL